MRGQNLRKKKKIKPMGKSPSRIIRFYLPPVIYGILILIVSSIPLKAPNINLGFQIDKLLHLLEYFIFTILLIRAFKNSTVRTLKDNALLIDIIFIILYGSLDEFYQSFIPNRDSSIFDVLFDTIGGVIGSISCLFTKR